MKKNPYSDANGTCWNLSIAVLCSTMYDELGLAIAQWECHWMMADYHRWSFKDHIFYLSCLYVHINVIGFIFKEVMEKRYLIRGKWTCPFWNWAIPKHNSEFYLNKSPIYVSHYDNNLPASLIHPLLAIEQP